jgi:sodium pump decarboxylase gamma subunit
MSEALQTGLYLTVAGMGLVFLMLAMLWGLIALLLKLDREPEPDAAAAMAESVLSAAEGRLRPELVATIAAAVQAYRADKRFGGVTHAASPAQAEIDYWSLAGRVQQQRVWRHGRRN